MHHSPVVMPAPVGEDTVLWCRFWAVRLAKTPAAEAYMVTTLELAGSGQWALQFAPHLAEAVLQRRPHEAHVWLTPQPGHGPQADCNLIGFE